MHHLSTVTLAQLEADRWHAQQAARPVATPEQRAQVVADLMLAAIKDGRLADARRCALALKPLLKYLPE